MSTETPVGVRVRDISRGGTIGPIAELITRLAPSRGYNRQPFSLYISTR